MSVSEVNQHPAVGTDVEKSVAQVDTEAALDHNDSDEKGAGDNESTFKQEGVRQVEAITQVWSRRTIVVMFIL